LKHWSSGSQQWGTQVLVHHSDSSSVKWDDSSYLRGELGLGVMMLEKVISPAWDLVSAQM
jgi:hypothetical protein